MKQLFLIFNLMMLAGCSSKAFIIPLEPYTAANNKATVFIFTESDICQTVFVDSERAGDICEDNYQRVELTPGEHTIYATPHTGMYILALFSNTGIVIRQEEKIKVEAGRIYTYTVFFKMGSWTNKNLVMPYFEHTRNYYEVVDVVLSNNREHLYQSKKSNIQELNKRLARNP